MRFYKPTIRTGRLARSWLGFLLLLFLAGCQDRGGDLPPGTAAAGAVKLMVTTDGMHRVGLEDLKTGGLDLATLDAGSLTLTSAGAAVPFFIESDQLFFWGVASSDRYSAENPYILRTGTPGTTMAVTEGIPPGSSGAFAIPQQLHREQDAIYASSARIGGQEDVWFWQTLQPEAIVDLTLNLPAIAPGPATLNLALWGASYDDRVVNDHDFDVLINGTHVGSVSWEGQTGHIAELTIPDGILRAGSNDLRLDNTVPGATFVDVMQLNWVSLDYLAPAAAVDDRLLLSGVAGTVRLSGFSGPVRLFDVSDRTAPVHIADVATSGGAIDVMTAVNQTFAAVGPAGFRTPVVLPLRESSWRETSQQADLLIITTDALASELEPLVTARVEQGLNVAVVPVAEIYDEFGEGTASPESIRAFLRYTQTEWAPPQPGYLLLVGQATYDYRNNLEQMPANHVPSLMVPVTYSGETVSDVRLADVDDDFRPDLAVGRWPVDSPAQVRQLVERTLAYEHGVAADQVIFAADGTEAIFASISDRLLDGSQLAGDDVSRLYGASANEVASQWNEGSWLVTYTGHGSLDKWGKDDVFTVDSVSQLEKGQIPPIVLQFTCLSGFFAHPTVSSISEVLLLAEGGPVLMVAATSLTLSTHQEPFAIALLNALQAEDIVRMGDAMQAAKLALDVSDNGLREISDTFGLIGDPSAIILRPGTGARS